MIKIIWTLKDETELRLTCGHTPVINIHNSMEKRTTHKRRIETMKVLSIDAWRDGSGWTWNTWCTVGNVDKATFETLNTSRKQIKWFRDEGYLNAESAGRVSIDDDGYNVVVAARGTGQPLCAIEYGPEY